MFACPHSRLHRAAVATAALFGVITLLAGGRVLFGFGEAGYVVVRPVLVFNTAMGLVYLATAAVAVRNVVAGRRMAIGVAVVNALVLGLVIARRASGGEVATETMGAMAFRTLAWVGIATLLALAYRAKGGPSTHADQRA